jgi:hypothetical protein
MRGGGTRAILRQEVHQQPHHSISLNTSINNAISVYDKYISPCMRAGLMSIDCALGAEAAASWARIPTELFP